MDEFVDGNGLFAISGHHEAAHIAYLGLHALQHRGHTGVALASTAGTGIRSWSGRGQVAEAVGGAEITGLPGTLACGTVWGGDRAAPADSGLVTGRTSLGPVAAVMSGRFTNGEGLRAELQSRGALFAGQSDAELLLHWVAQSSLKTMVNRIVDALWRVKGAYSMVLLTEDRLVAVRDPSGFRPLVLGRLGEARVIATEDAAIRFAGGIPERALEAGEMVVLEGSEVQAVRPFSAASSRPCAHEWVALSRADAQLEGGAVYPVRRELGAHLAAEQPCPHVDVVVAVPGAEAQAEGFAAASDLPVAPALLRAPFAPTHLEDPPSEGRSYGARAQLQAVPALLSGKRVCVVAASSPRGITASRAVQIVGEAGALEVHLRVASPWVRRGCRYGVASPTQEQLLDPAMVEPGAAVEPLGARSLGFLSLEALGAALGRSTCDACFSGTFPIAPEEPDDQLDLFHPDRDE